MISAGRGVGHGIAHPCGDAGDDLPVRLCLAGRRNGLSDPLDPSFRVGEGAVLFRKAGGGEDHVGQLRRFRQEDVLDDEKIEVLQGRLDMGEIGIGQHGVFTHDIEGLDLSLVGGVHDFHDGFPRFGRERRIPGLFEFRPRLVVGDRLVGGEDVGQRPHVAGALDVVLSAQRIDAAALDADLAAEHGQVGAGLDVVRAGDVLRHPHGVEDGGLVCLGIQAGGRLQILRGNAGDLLDVLGRVFLDGLLQGLEAFRPVFHIFLGVRSLRR